MKTPNSGIYVGKKKNYSGKKVKAFEFACFS
jgi:hypothetical protein